MATEYLLKVISPNESVLLYDNVDKTVQTKGQVLTLLDDVANYKLLYFEYYDGANVGVVVTEMAIVESILNVADRKLILTYRYGSVARYMYLVINNTTVTVSNRNAGYLCRIYGVK